MVAMRILEDGWDGMGGRGWDVGGGGGEWSGDHLGGTMGLDGMERGN